MNDIDPGAPIWHQRPLIPLAFLISFIAFSGLTHMVPTRIEMRIAVQGDRRLSRHPYIASTLDVPRAVLTSPGGVVLIAIAVAIAAFEKPRMKARSNILAGTALLVYLCALYVPRVFARAGPDINNVVNPYLGFGVNTYPDTSTLAAVAFYGTVAIFAWTSLQRKFLRWLVTLICVAIITESALTAIVFALAWISDVVGGLLLGASFAAGALYVDRFVRGE